MASECSIIRYFKTKNVIKKILGRGTAPFKNPNLPLVLATVLAAAPMSAPSLARQLEATPATVTSAAAVAPAVAWAGSQPSGPWSPWSPVRQAPKSMASPVVDLAKMEGRQSMSSY